MHFRKIARGRWDRRITSRSTSPTLRTRRGHRRDQEPARRRRAACAGQQRRDLAQGRGRQAAGLGRHHDRDWEHVFQVNFFAPIMLARGLMDELEAAQGRGGERHLDRRLARASFRRRRLFDIEGGARRADPRNGVRLWPASAFASTRSRRARSTRRSSRPAPRRSSGADPDAAARHARRSRQDHLCAVHRDERLT